MKVEEVAATMSMEVVFARMRMIVLGLPTEKSSWLYKWIYELMIKIICNDYGNGVLSNYEEDGMGQDSRVVRSCRFVVAWELWAQKSYTNNGKCYANTVSNDFS